MWPFFYPENTARCGNNFREPSGNTQDEEHPPLEASNQQRQVKILTD
jgi:hypothetical protein